MRARALSLIGFVAFAKLAGFVIVAPVAACILRFFLSRTGRASVGNFEIAEFALSVPGIIAMLLLGSLALAVFWLEQAGLMLVLAAPAEKCVGWWDAAISIARRSPRLAGLGLRQFAVYLMIVGPAAFLAMIAILSLWAGRDINGLLVLKPPIFWIGVAVAGAILAVSGAIAFWFTLHRFFALSAILFEPDATPRLAMRSSIERTRGRRRSILITLLIWFTIAALASVAIGAGMRFASGAILTSIGESLPVLLTVTAIVLLANILIGTLLSMAADVGLAGLTLRLYHEAGGPINTDDETRVAAAPPDRSSPRRTRALVVASCGLLVLATALLCRVLLSRLELNEKVEISAHRAGGALAPENSFAALRICIEAGADWVETDVQRTADNALVMLHDTDLFRIDGTTRRVQDLTLADIKALDLGAAFNNKFPGERIPTLDEYIAAASNAIRFNIELKPHGPDDVTPLAEMTVQAVQRAGIQSRTRICSQSYEGIRLCKQLEPSIEIGYIAGAAIGDLSAINVDFLMVNANLVTRKLTDQCAARGIEVHAWTINDPDLVLSLVDRGATNIITDDAGMIRTRLDDLRDLHPAERLLLRVRNYLAD